MRIETIAGLINIVERKQESCNPFYRVVELTDETTDPVIWGKNFPLQYDACLRTVDQERTRFGDSEAVPRTPSRANPRPIVAQSRLETIQGRTFEPRNLAMPPLVDLIKDITSAHSAGVAEPALAKPRSFNVGRNFSSTSPKRRIRWGFTPHKKPLASWGNRSIYPAWDKLPCETACFPARNPLTILTQCRPCAHLRRSRVGRYSLAAALQLQLADTSTLLPGGNCL